MTRNRWAQKAAGGLLLLAMAFGGVVQAEDPVKVVEYPDSNYDPGPGWPEGWTPPPVPEQLREGYVQWLEEQLQTYPRFKRWEVRVMDPLPKWTKEYPYEWVTDEVDCGDTIYVYWYPRPDTALIYKTTGKSYTVAMTLGGECEFAPIRAITEAKPIDEETRSANERAFRLQDELDAAHPGLHRGYGGDEDGSPDNIQVFFNAGHASPTFDTPAYLDPAVGRVRVPIRFISELMEATVDWNEATGRVSIHFPEITREVTKAVPAPGLSYSDIFRPYDYLPYAKNYLLETQLITSPEKRIVLTVGENKAVVDGKEVFLDAPPVVRDGRVMVPIRFVAEQIGAKVYWVGDKPIFRRAGGVVNGTYQVHIFTKFFPLYEYPSWYLEQFGVKV